MSINMNTVMAKVRAWEKSEEGQKRINAVTERYRKEGRTVTAAGSHIVTEKEMRQAAYKLAEIVKKTARRSGYDLPEHVLEDIDSLTVSGGVEEGKDGQRVIRLSFGNDLSRESLRKENGDRTGGGVRNIIAIFNNGYEARIAVYGWWDDHAPSSKKNVHYGDHDTAWVRSTVSRPALRFMQQAVAEFNSRYGEKYGVKAVLDDEYTKD